jgi:tricorn protease
VKYAGLFAAAAVLAFAAGPGRAAEVIRLANHPALSPDGATLVFDWDGDIWSVPTTGGVARRLTNHPARDREPAFSPDGKQIAFVSERGGSPQVHVMPAAGGTPWQLTCHTAGCSLQEWCPDGRRLFLSAARDHFWRHAERFFTVSAESRQAEPLLFDDYGQDGRLSPDGRQLLFTREGPPWWRKGYHSSQASQVWLYELDSKSFRRILDEDTGCRWPLWEADSKGFYYVGARSGSFNLWEHDLASGESRQLTRFTDDSVAFPCISRDGSTLVFRHLFDLYCYRPGKDESPRKIDIRHDSDPVKDRVERRVLRQASEAAFTADGLEIAFIAGGDLWVMDTELREPRSVTATAEEERHPVFSPDGQTLLFTADRDARCDIWRAVRADKDKPWWRNSRCTLERLTDDGEVKNHLTFSPDGSRIAYLRARGDLWIADADGRNARKVIASWNESEYDWSPDGKWLVYAQSDSDFNRDVWIIAADGSRKPFNLSRHPYNDGNPVWSPDGRLIAFTGRRGLSEVDIHYVWLRAEDDEKSGRERTLDKAMEKINKVRNKPHGGADERPAAPGQAKAPEVVIDFENLHRRIHRIAIPHSTENGLFWSPDSKKLAFTAPIEVKRGTYAVDIPDDPKPKLLTTQTGRQARWLKQENGGGNTADHLLTALTQPVHAISVPRGGEPGYPHDRKIYATWSKPIVVLCNQNSFSNAEIFSHAIKTLKRGQLIGVPTAGGVISTGAKRIMDVGVSRVPYRGWFLRDSGEDMELNGAVPDHVLWPRPGQMPAGEDVQLTKAIEVLQQDVRAWKERPRPPLRKASERSAQGPIKTEPTPAPSGMR